MFPTLSVSRSVETKGIEGKFGDSSWATLDAPCLVAAPAATVRIPGNKSIPNQSAPSATDLLFHKGQNYVSEDIRGLLTRAEFESISGEVFVAGPTETPSRNQFWNWIKFPEFTTYCNDRFFTSVKFTLYAILLDD